MPHPGRFHGRRNRVILPVVPQVKGSAMLSRRDFVLRYHGPAAWRTVHDALAAPDRVTWDGTVIADAWYPFEACARLERVIVESVADGDERICADIGAFSAAENLASLYQTFLSNGEDPVAFYRGFERRHAAVYDFGTMMVAQPQGRAEIQIVHDFEGFATRTNCLVTLGFFRGAGVSVAIPRLRVEEKWCQALGNASCLVVVQWGDVVAKP